MASALEMQEAEDCIDRLNEQIAALKAENERLTGLICWATNTLYEINPSNYDHDEVCKLNDASVEVILGLSHHLGERHGKSEQWWKEHLATSSVPQAEAAERALAERAGGVKATHRHKKRGTEYVLIGIGKMQAENWYLPGAMEAGPSVDMQEVAIYRSAIDPAEIWVRPREEFEDGRFEALTTEPAVPAPMTGEDIRRIFQPLPEAELTVLREVDPDTWGHPTAAPEGRQEADAVLASALKLAREYRPTMDKDILHSWASDAVKVIRVLSDRPSEQAVTEADKRRILDIFEIEWKINGLDPLSALKAAMEAGR